MSGYKYADFRSDRDDDWEPKDKDSSSSFSDDDEPKKKKKPGKPGKKPLSADTKAGVKGNAKKKVKKKILDDLSVNPNLFLPVAKDLSPYEIIVGAKYDLFDDPADAPAGVGKHGYKGCQRATITLGPKQQLGQVGTNSSGIYPLAKADAEATYTDQTFVSGHVVNADFGGPDAASNMTILTSSANGQQKLFDNHVKNARNALYAVYKDLASLGPIDPNFFDNLKYGIKLDIRVGVAGGVWDANYPGNCISNSITLTATVENEVNVQNAIANANTVFTNPRQIVLKGLPNRLTAVFNEIVTANSGSPIDNAEY